jgi:hypothetical protein
MPPAVVALNIGVGPCWGETCGDMLEAMARIAPSQPSDAMERIASRRNRTISLDPNLPGQNSRERFFRRRFKIVFEGSKRFERGLGENKGKLPRTTSQSVRTHNFTFSLAAISDGSPPVVRRLLFHGPSSKRRALKSEGGKSRIEQADFGETKREHGRGIRSRRLYFVCLIILLLFW